MICMFPNRHPVTWRFLICPVQLWAFWASHTRLLRSPLHPRSCSSTALCLRPQWRDPASMILWQSVLLCCLFAHLFVCTTTESIARDWYHLLFCHDDHCPHILFSVWYRTTPTAKYKIMEFSLIGEGILPSVCVLRPAPRSRGGSPLLHFRRVPIGQRLTLPLVLVNDGNIPAQVGASASFPFYLIPKSVLSMYTGRAKLPVFTKHSRAQKIVDHLVDKVQLDKILLSLKFLCVLRRSSWNCWINTACSPSELLLATHAGPYSAQCEKTLLIQVFKGLMLECKLTISSYPFV